MFPELWFHVHSAYTHHIRKAKLPYSLEFISEKDDSLRLLAGRIHHPKVSYKVTWADSVMTSCVEVVSTHPQKTCQGCHQKRAIKDA